MEPVNLICLPFAGGNKFCYRPFQDKLPSYLNLITLEYPGRGTRPYEPLLTDMDQLTGDVFRQFEKVAGNRRYALYGHSMGGLTACLLVRKILRENIRPPLHLFITGTAGPSAASREERKRHLLSKAEFIAELKSLNGSPPELLENEMLLDYFEPIIRADFKVSETFAYREQAPLNIPLTVITGTEEDMMPEEIMSWQQESYIPVDFKTMAGGHFFIFDQTRPLINIMAEKLSPYVNIMQL
jgi:surfactin synthase thioesterase subunit